jgi:hypothetical protein
MHNKCKKRADKNKGYKGLKGKNRVLINGFRVSVGEDEKF